MPVFVFEKLLVVEPEDPMRVDGAEDLHVVEVAFRVSPKHIVVEPLEELRSVAAPEMKWIRLRMPEGFL